MGHDLTTTHVRLSPIPLHAGRGLRLVRGEGSYLWDDRDRRYLDLMTNYGVNLLGHSHPEVTAAITNQAARLTNAHQSFDTPARDEFLQARFAPQYVGLSGAGGFKDLELQKLLAGKLASASPFVSLSTHGISGSASPADLETALQLLYAEVTDPGDDPDAFALMTRQLPGRDAVRVALKLSDDAE